MTKVTLCTALAPEEATWPKHGKDNGIDDLQHFQEPHVWVNGLSWPQDWWCLLSQRLWRVFGNCLQYPSMGSLILSPTVLLISMQHHIFSMSHWMEVELDGSRVSSGHMIPTSNFWDREFPSYSWDKTTVYIILVGQPFVVRPAIQQHAILDLVIGWDGSTMEECHRGRGMGWWVVQHDVMISRPFGRRGSCVVNLCDFTYRSISILLFHWISQHLNIWSWYT